MNRINELTNQDYFSAKNISKIFGFTPKYSDELVASESWKKHYNKL